MEPKQKQYPVVDMTDDGSKVQCCKQQYCKTSECLTIPIGSLLGVGEREVNKTDFRELTLERANRNTNKILSH